MLTSTAAQERIRDHSEHHRPCQAVPAEGEYPTNFTSDVLDSSLLQVARGQISPQSEAANLQSAWASGRCPLQWKVNTHTVRPERSAPWRGASGQAVATAPARRRSAATRRLRRRALIPALIFLAPMLALYGVYYICAFVFLGQTSRENVDLSFSGATRTRAGATSSWC